MTEIELSEHLSKKLKTEHDITNLSTDWSVTKINNFAKIVLMDVWILG